MKIFLVTDIKIFIYKGKIVANQKHSTILRRYYNAFGPMVLCARFGVVASVTKSLDDISDIVVSVVEVQSLYRMFFGMYNRKLETGMRDCDFVICRCPSVAAFKAADIARKLGKPYLAESMGDPWDAYWNHGSQGKAIAPYMFFKMKHVVRNADYAVYVTKEYLQSRYPCKNENVAVSDVLIEETKEEILQKRIERLNTFDHKNITLMTTAAIDVWYKGQQYVIKAIPALNKAGVRIKYRIVGEGDNTFLKGVAQEVGVLDQVEFPGRLPLDQVFELLDDTDIYIQPSLQEGLPRSVIEAMSRGCACIGARTAGIPELLQDDMVIKRKSYNEIAEKILTYIEMQKKDREIISRRNFQEAKKYGKDKLDAIRNAYYSRIKHDLLKGLQ